MSSAEKWARAIAALVEASHLATGGSLSSVLDRAVRPLGFSAELLLADLSQQVLSPVRDEPDSPVSIEGTVAGRAYQLVEILAAIDARGTRTVWVPMVDGVERVGVLHIRLGADVADDAHFRAWLWTLSGLMGHIVASKIPYSDRLHRLRSVDRLTLSAEMLWQMLPPRTFATDNIVVTALLEPAVQVAGDAYDYAVDSSGVTVGVFDGVGHDLPATQVTSLVLTALRNLRRAGETDPGALAAVADEALAAHGGGISHFVTAVLARLETSTGVLNYTIAGHPPPLLLRDGHLVKELAAPPRVPLGVILRGRPPTVVAREQLEPGDRVLFYSDGITEARDRDGNFFGEERLVDLAERAEQDRLNAPETLRRLVAAVLAHQRDRLQDDATLMLLSWSAREPGRLFPTLP